MKLLQYIWKNSYLKICNSKMGIFTVLILVTCWSYQQPLRRFMDAVDYPVNWCVFPFLISNMIFAILFLFGIIYIHSDVPFLQHMNLYQMMRTGKTRWAIGQIGGIFLRSVCAALITVFASLLPLVTDIEWTNEWGKLLRTAAMTDAESIYGFQYSFYYEIFSAYTPLELLGISILITVLVCTFFGLWMFFWCLYSNRILAVALSVGIAVLIFFVENSFPQFRYLAARLAPSVCLEVARAKTPNLGYFWYPSIEYVLFALILSGTVLSLLILWKVRHMEFHWENEDI